SLEDCLAIPRDPRLSVLGGGGHRHVSTHGRIIDASEPCHRDCRFAAAACLRIARQVCRRLRRADAVAQQGLAGQTDCLALAGPGRRRPVRARPPARRRTGRRRRLAPIGPSQPLAAPRPGGRPPRPPPPPPPPAPPPRPAGAGGGRPPPAATRAARCRSKSSIMALHLKGRRTVL